ncbi:MAG: class F sortase [Ilumatobacteraceae bacterium]
MIRRFRIGVVGVGATLAALGACATEPAGDDATASSPAVVAPAASDAAAEPAIDAQSVPTTDLAGVEAASGSDSSDSSDRASFADAIIDVGSARYDPDQHRARPAPIGISIPSLGVEDAPVEPVGVDEVGFLDVPDPKLVGWYRSSATPGSPGAAVLASHVNYDRVPGVFRYLRDLDVGAEITVMLDSATSQRFVVTEVALFDKDELPRERIWTTSGDPSLVLITCGGRYDAEARSYEDNVVAFAEPL